MLGRYSLISGSNSDDVRVHRLVQLMVRDAIGEEGRRYWAGAVLRNMANAVPAHSGDVPTWPRCARLLPHALVAAAHAESALTR